MKINCIVIEDEPLALKKINEFISQVEYLNLLEGFDNAVKAIGFLKSVEKVYNNLVTNNIEQKPDYIFVKTEYRIEKIELKSILYIQGMKDYLQIFTIDKKIMTLQSFKNLVQVLPYREFVRVHNSYMVSISKIDSIERNRIKIGDNLVPISNSYKDNFYNLLQASKYLI